MTFDLYPAIDLRGGNCVRLYKGDYGEETVYGTDPVAQAQQFAREGAAWIHIVDLDAARTGDPVNREVIAAIAAGVDVPLQVGGGVRSVEAAEALFAVGVTRVVIGTAAIENPGLVAQLTAKGHRVAVGLDGRNGEVAVHGWQQGSGRQVIDVAGDFADSGADAFIVTEIERDGTLEGPDIAGLSALLAATDIEVIASGGVGNLADIDALRSVKVDGKTLGGVIAGKAIYEGRFTVAQATRPRTLKSVRVIPCLDVDAGRVVKGINFVDLVDAGDPVELAARYDTEGADELIFLDITASSDSRDTIIDVVRRTAEQVFIPFTIGGGIRTVEDARKLLRAGADKVSVNTAAVDRPELVAEIANEFGSQCAVVSIDARGRDDGTFEVFIHGGRTPTGIDAVEWAQRVEALGAGEIMLTSMDRDGTRDGFDIPLTQAITDAVNIPVIASGGVGNLDHLVEGVTEGGADAVLAASIFHFGEFTVAEAKERMADNGITVRPAD